MGFTADQHKEAISRRLTVNYMVPETLQMENSEGGLLACPPPTSTYGRAYLNLDIEYIANSSSEIYLSLLYPILMGKILNTRPVTTLHQRYIAAG